MKTFEERYTAWIDNKLDGPALTSFELELSRRASAGEARADKADAARLNRLLTTHLQAPAMTNVEFFSHQLRERIEAERASGHRREEARQARGSFFTWPFARLAGLGAAGIFVATALYYGMMPPHIVSPTPQVAVNPTPVIQDANTAAPDAIPGRQPDRHNSGGPFVFNSPTPPPVDLNGDIQVIPVPATSKNTSATPLQYKDPNVSVLWINGLDYMPSVPGEASVSPAPVPAKSVAP